MRTRRGRERRCFLGVLFFSVIYNVTVIGNAVLYGWKAAGLIVVSGLCAVMAESLVGGED